MLAQWAFAAVEEAACVGGAYHDPSRDRYSVLLVPLGSRYGDRDRYRKLARLKETYKIIFVPAA